MSKKRLWGKSKSAQLSLSESDLLDEINEVRVEDPDDVEPTLPRIEINDFQDTQPIIVMSEYGLGNEDEILMQSEELEPFSIVSAKQARIRGHRPLGLVKLIQNYWRNQQCQ